MNKFVVCMNIIINSTQLFMCKEQHRNGGDYGREFAGLYNNIFV